MVLLQESDVEESLQKCGLVTPEDIDYVLMTHLHFDHACGLTKLEEESMYLFFQTQNYYFNIEWNEMRNPNIRSKSTYWKENWEAIRNTGEYLLRKMDLGAIRMIHTGGHSDGHSILVIEDGGEIVIHMADIMPTHAHQNVLWVMAYDDYPMNSIAAKEKWLQYGLG